MNYYRSHDYGINPFLVITLSVVIILALCGLIWMEHLDRETLNIQVQEKEFVTHGSGNSATSHYLVWSRAGEVFSVDDSLIEGQWDSSTVYGRIHEGECYTIDVYGWRVEFMSWYRNIVGVTPIECDN